MNVPESITARLAQLDAIEATYLKYAQQRLDERDFHGLWDVAINLTEVSNERDGLHLAVKAFEALTATNVTVHAQMGPAWRPPLTP